MIVYHGTNKNFKRLRPNSFLTDNPHDAMLFAEIKGGGTVYSFEVNENQVIPDNTPFAKWFLSVGWLIPIGKHY